MFPLGRSTRTSILRIPIESLSRSPLQTQPETSKKQRSHNRAVEAREGSLLGMVDLDGRDVSLHGFLSCVVTNLPSLTHEVRGPL